MSAGRLRRTIGPFIRNRPDGAFGLAVISGHASSIIGAGYGGMKQSASTRFLPRENADHIAATLNNINSSLDSGGGLGLREDEGHVRGGAASQAGAPGARTPGPQSSRPGL